MKVEYLQFKRNCTRSEIPKGSPSTNGFIEERIKKIKSGSIFEENADTCGDYGDTLPNFIDGNTW